MEKNVARTLEFAGYGFTAIFASCALMAALDNWLDKIPEMGFEKTHFYENIYEFMSGHSAPAEKLTQHAFNGRVGVFSTFAGFSFAIARWGRSSRLKKV